MSENLKKKANFKENLEEFKERYLNLIQQASDGIMHVSEENIILEFNRKCEEIYGYSRDEVVGKPVSVLLPARMFQMHRRGFKNFLLTKAFERLGRTIEATGIKKDGTEFPLEFSFFFLKKEKPYIFSSLIRDITKRKEIEYRIKRQNQELMTLNSIARTVSQSLDLEEVLKLALKRTLETLNAERGVIFLKDHLTGLSFVPRRGKKNDEARRYRKNMKPMGEKTLEQVRRNGEIVYMNDYDEPPLMIKSLVSVPLKSKGKVVGVMNIGAYRKDFLSKEDIPLLQSIGSTVGIAAENALLFKEVRSKSSEVESERTKLKHLTEKLVRAQEEERKKISRELHDETGQLMSTLQIDLGIVRRELPPGKRELKEIFDNALSLVDRTLSEIRRISSHLHPSVLDTLGLIPAIKSYVEDYRKRFDVTIEFNYTGLDGRMDHNIETAIYRCVQESVTNAIKHSGTKYLCLNLVKSPDKMIAMIKDEGKGFDVAQVSSRNSKTGLGLLGIKERVSLMGGRVKINSRVGSGTSIRIEIPVK